MERQVGWDGEAHGTRANAGLYAARIPRSCIAQFEAVSIIVTHEADQSSQQLTRSMYAMPGETTSKNTRRTSAVSSS